MIPYTKASRSSEVSQREKDNLQVAYEAACEGIVLLKNDGTLPLQTRKVALFGPGASMTIKGGTGSGEVNERHSVTILEGMTDRGFEITSGKWIGDFEAQYQAAAQAFIAQESRKLRKPRFSELSSLLLEGFRGPTGRAITQADVDASDTDTCIYVLSRQAGEGGDRKAEKGDMFLTDPEREAIRFCAEKYAHFVLVINSGSSIDMAFAGQIPGINAIVFICQLGTEGGHAFADMLTGQVCPSGHLTDTWAKTYSDIPFSAEYSYLNGDLENENYKEGIYVGYRYFDSFGIEPAYPFGFGLSYTSFALGCAGVQADGRRITVSANVTNTGSCAGKEVAQLYVSAPNGQLDKEYQSLAAFAKTDTLAPGQSQTVELCFDLTGLASYRQSDSCFVLEKGEYILRLGEHSRSTVPAGVLTLAEDVIVSRHSAICPLQQPLEELKSPARAREELPDGLPRIPVDPAAIETVCYEYRTPPVRPDADVKQFLDTLSLPEMVDIVVGVNDPAETPPRFHLPGAVANTTSRFWDRGLVNVALCDGPAGLRIRQNSAISSSGLIRPLNVFCKGTFSSVAKKFAAADPNKDTPLYQYATAFPVTAALAQSWNTALMEQVGRAVFREMKEYGCTYWLAPAINIHRNPLCGRNFEYYSEDPRLTGLMAAAITRGVQQEPGYYVTVKHFACNNQEDNRTFVSSNVSERALREIYLRAFQETVCSGGAKAVMTSYNRLNGVYTPNSYDLCTKVLRNEWGFDGVVMTDWRSTNRGQGNNAVAMQAGNDLIMPGGHHHKREILRGVASGQISREDVRRCCANVVRAILDSPTQKEYIG